jgi:hypothetical protein
MRHFGGHRKGTAEGDAAQKMLPGLFLEAYVVVLDYC